MAGLPWFAVCADFPNHPKTVRLCRKVGNPLGGMYVVNLWAFCVEYQQDGLFTGEDAGAMVEHATGWAGEPGVMLDALIHCGGSGIGFVEPRDGGFYVHEWVERNGAHIAKRQRDAERMREKRQVGESRASVARPSHDRLGGERQREGQIQGSGIPPVSGTDDPPSLRHRPVTLGLGCAEGQAFHHWATVAWPKVSDQPCLAATQSDAARLRVLCEKPGLDALKAAMDRAVADEWWRTRLDLPTFLQHVQKFTARKGAAKSATQPAADHSAFGTKTNEVKL